MASAALASSPAVFLSSSAPGTSGFRAHSNGSSVAAGLKVSSFTPSSASSFLPSSSSSKSTWRVEGLQVSCKVSVGDSAPSVTLKDQNGRNVSLNKFRGKNVVFYFYPQAETPGCTKQACSFRDAYTDFKKLGAEVIGVSGDTPEALKAFKEKYNLPYTLLSDEGNEVRKEWGVPGDLFGILPGRQTYVIDKKGIVKLVFNNQFQPEKHIDKTLEVLQS